MLGTARGVATNNKSGKAFAGIPFPEYRNGFKTIAVVSMQREDIGYVVLIC
jgi:hypothetical protein